MLCTKIKMRLGLMSYDTVMGTFMNAIDDLHSMNDVHTNYINSNLAVIDDLVAKNVRHTNARTDNKKAIDKLSEFLS
jgi:hypothetical protein